MSNISTYLENLDDIVVYFPLRYGGGYAMGIFTDANEFDRIQHASSYEYEQGEYREVFLQSGVMACVEGKDLFECSEKLEEQVGKILQVGKERHWDLREQATKAFVAEGEYNSACINYDELKKLRDMMAQFKTHMA